MFGVLLYNMRNFSFALHCHDERAWQNNEAWNRSENVLAFGLSFFGLWCVHLKISSSSPSCLIPCYSNDEEYVSPDDFFFGDFIYVAKIMMNFILRTFMHAYKSEIADRFVMCSEVAARSIFDSLTAKEFLL